MSVIEAKSKRGRPVGTGKDDLAALKRIVAFMIANPTWKPMVAIKRVCAPVSDSEVRRLYRKILAQGLSLKEQELRNRADAARTHKEAQPNFRDFTTHYAVADVLGSMQFMKAIQTLHNSPAMKAARELQKMPAMRAIREFQNSPAMRAMRVPHNSPAMKAARELQNSPAMRAMREFQNSPLRKVLALAHAPSLMNATLMSRVQPWTKSSRN